MSWLKRVCEQETISLLKTRDSGQSETCMSPGLTGEYDLSRREKAGEHQPPPPPEYMGLEGEYDQLGLAKRVAEAFEQAPHIDEIETLQICQDSSTIILKGSVPSQDILNHLEYVAAKVDGTKQVDTTQVKIAASA
ncbi:BON domain-containing protein [Nostoc parmelioides]|uniref:BON domain-containing protein n=1 Tax=Nostoc parmelioides FACHB-3921 TaxID=2692909 RepID=A0ABR8BQN6_9NOSO|nr:BON domain-containing protein [Nostoc parmelioides]MBD2255934.1 BON domain-containing protein [Nostoc parmelioides FACHB-3921]